MSRELFKENMFPERTLKELFEHITGRGNVIFNPTIIGGTLEGASYRSGSSNARVDIFPEDDKDIGFAVYDDSANVVFKAIIDGNDVGDIIIGDYSGGQGIKFDKSDSAIYFAGIDQLKTFIQDSVPTSENAGDLWFDSDNNNKAYRAAAAGADEVKAGEWVEVTADWDGVQDLNSHKPEDNATVGATAGTDLKDSGDTVLGDDEVKNVEQKTDEVTQILTAKEDISAGDVVYMRRWDEEVMSATDDTYTDSDNPTNTNCAEDKVVVAGVYLGFIKFDLTGHTKGSNMKAVMRLKIKSGPASTATVSLAPVTSSWSEASCPDYNNKPSVTAATSLDISAYSLGTGDDWLEADITEIFRYWLNNNNYGLQIDSDVSFQFHSSEASSEGDRPQLVIYDTATSTDIGKIAPALADDGLTSYPIVGIAKENITAGSSGKVVVGRGTKIITSSDIGAAEVGQSMYLSASTAGEMNFGGTAGNWSVPIGYAYEAGTPGYIVLDPATPFKRDYFTWNSSSGTGTAGSGEKIIYTGFQPKFVKVVASTTNGLSVGESECTGSEGSINQRYHMQNATTTDQGDTYIAKLNTNVWAKLYFLGQNYIVFSVSSDSGDNTHYTIECYG